MANRETPGPDRRDRPVVGRQHRAVDLAARGDGRPDRRRSGSGRRSMSRRRRQSPARRGRLRSIFAPSACACGSAAFGPAGDDRLKGRSLETRVRGCASRCRQRDLPLGSCRPRTSPKHRRRRPPTAAARFAQHARSRTRPSRPARCSTMPSVGTSVDGAAARPTERASQPVVAADRQVRRLEPDARRRASASARSASVASYEPSTIIELEARALVRRARASRRSR